MEKFITTSAEQTQEMGKMLAQEILESPLEKSARIICLDGELGAGKTTFTQGLLEGLGAEGPYTSPTFLVMKQYEIEKNKTQDTRHKQITNSKFQKIYHIDAYRVESSDILDLGWEEIAADNKNVIIVEWAERVKDIILGNAVWMRFEWAGEEEREISAKT